MDIWRSPFKYFPKNSSKNTPPRKNIKAYAPKEADIYHESITVCILSTNLGNSLRADKS